MTQPILSIRSDMTSQEALVVAKMNSIHHLPLQENGKIVGLICTCDLRDLELQAPVSESLHRDPVVVSPEETTRRIAELMRTECISSVLVRDPDGWGIVTKDDLVHAPLQDTKTLELIEACRCVYCTARNHLRRSGNDFVCVTCLERAEHPEKFESGEVD